VIALGLRVKSGHAIAIALDGSRASPRVRLRRDVALCDPATPATKQPYHDGFGTAQADARIIARLTAIVRRVAIESVGALVDDARALDDAGRGAMAACLIVGSVIDPDAVGNPHIRAHANEGRLFRTVVEDALRARAIGCRVIVEKRLAVEAVSALKRSEDALAREVARLGRTLGGPWRADEKAAALGAWLMLERASATSRAAAPSTGRRR
jgi:hypothetical protein